MTTLENKIIILFIGTALWRLSTWEIANNLYGGCMQRKHKRNGAIIANICKTANRSKSLHLEGGYVSFIDKKPFFNKNLRPDSSPKHWQHH